MRLIHADFLDRIAVLLSIVCAGLIFAESYFVAAIVSWIQTAITIPLALFRSPAIKLNIHWRVLFLYLMNVVSTILLAIKYAESGTVIRGGLIALACLKIITSIVSALFLFLFPLPGNLALVGPYPFIGTTSFNLTLDPTYRDQPEYKNDVFDKYNTILPLQCWFPLKPSGNPMFHLFDWFFGRKTMLWTSGHPTQEYEESVLLLNNVAKNYGLPVAITRHLSLARTKSTWQEDLSHIATPENSSTSSTSSVSQLQVTKKMPIAIYVHGMYGWRQLHTSLAERLASAGFLVLAGDHAPDCMVSRPIKQTNTNSKEPQEESQPFDFHVPDGTDASAERAFYTSGFCRRLRDIKELVDEITSGRLEARYPQLQGKLDYNHICLWGHSFGGGTVTAFACRDNRPVRIAALDGWLYPIPDRIRRRGLGAQTQALNISCTLWKFAKFQFPYREDILRRSHPLALSQSYNLIFTGTDHQNYCETYIIASPMLLKRPSVLGKEREPRKVVDALDKLVVGFFARPVVSNNIANVNACVNQENEDQESLQLMGVRDINTLLKDMEDNVRISSTMKNRMIKEIRTAKDVLTEQPSLVDNANFLRAEAAYEAKLAEESKN